MEKLKIYKLFGIILGVLATVCTGAAIYNVYLLHKIETFYRIMGCTLLVLFLIVIVYSIIESIISRKKAKYFVSIVFAILLSLVGAAIAILIHSVYSKLTRMSNTTEEVIYTTKLIALEDKGTLDSLSGLKIGLVDNEEDYVGNILPLEVIEKNELSKNNEIKKISDTITLMNMLLKKELDAIFIGSSYKEMFKKVDDFDESTTFVEITSYSKTYEKKEIEPEEQVEASEITKPFTILLLGVDSDEEEMDPNLAFNGDTIMVIAVDPVTLNVTMFSIPRDTYVTMGCGGNITKINAATWGGTGCMVRTVEKLTGITMNYYVKVNFRGVVDLVDALGGVTIDVPMDFCETDSHRWGGDGYTVCLSKGVQKLNGEQALAVARHRKTLPTGDFQRGQNQQVVVEGMFNSLKNIKTVSDFYSVLDTVSKNLETNMSTNEMLSLYNFMKEILVKSGDIKPNITKTYLTGYSLYDWTGYYDTYTFQYYRHSLNSIVTALKQNLGLAEKPEIKNISFSINSPYERAIVGYDFTPEAKKVTMPYLVGMEPSAAVARAQSLGLVVETTEQWLPCEDWYYDNIVFTQSIHEGTLLERVSNRLTLVISRKDEAACALEKANQNSGNNSGNNDPGENNSNNNENNQTTDPGNGGSNEGNNGGEGSGSGNENNGGDGND